MTKVSVIWEGDWSGNRWRICMSESIFAVEKKVMVMDLVSGESTSVWQFELNGWVIHKAFLDLLGKR